MNGEVIAFILYFLVVLGIGIFFFLKSKNAGEKEYFLGGRSMGPWVTALSAQASDMSAWLLMGLPGSILAGFRAGSPVRRTEARHPQYPVVVTDDRQTVALGLPEPAVVAELLKFSRHTAVHPDVTVRAGTHEQYMFYFIRI